MKEFFGTDLSLYNAAGIKAIHQALRYELVLYRVYCLWSSAFILAGVFYVYFNHHLFATNEMLKTLALFWAISGFPFFLLRDLAKSKFAAVLPDQDLKTCPKSDLKLGIKSNVKPDLKAELEPNINSELEPNLKAKPKAGLNPALSTVKLLAGLFFGSWETHVMLIYALAKYAELKNYDKKLAAAMA